MSERNRQINELFAEALRHEHKNDQLAVTGDRIAFHCDFLSSCESILVNREKLHDGRVIYETGRGFGGAGFDSYEARLGIDKQETNKIVIKPYLVEMITRKPFIVDQDILNSGLSEGYYSFTDIKGKHGYRCLRQRVSLDRLVRDYSPTLSMVSLSRVVTSEYEATHGFVVFQDDRIATKLGVEPKEGDPFCMVLSSKGHYPAAIGSVLLSQNPIPIEKLASLGIGVEYEDNDSEAYMVINSDGIVYCVRMEKNLIPNYPEVMFNESEEWIFKGGIFVGRV